jgi:hypothetical protein
MPFSDTQARQLKAKLDAQHVKTRKGDGGPLHYIEGWHAIAEANRIFGYDAWDRRTLATRCVWTGVSDQHYLAAYIAKVRIRVRAGDITIVREGSGTGEGKALTPGQAHELALKSAETDATKRALATFGNPFGLALYDREQTGVRHRPKTATEEIAEGPWILRSAVGAANGTFNQPDEFATALRREMTEAQNIERLFEVWEQNIATVRALSYVLKKRGRGKDEFAKHLVEHLKSCARSLVNARGEVAQEGTETESLGLQNPETTTHNREKIDKSVLTLGETKRIRSKEHLRYVARQPCLICGRTPSHAHHIRYAQSRGLSLKVSDEFTVPLCAIHHSQNHATGDERRWWQERKIDPLPVAEGLWKRSQKPAKN